ncbi:hypothetical protein B0A52_01396 [Exophiala mesophila]|uniref:GPI anchored protein n=1 Tax=Exophiala mesophila TaxID=212818 RepID=A0A438NHA2_EXOME|nr:hypothetical protein B0A52_01396 [Exophiala mesophila]
MKNPMLVATLASVVVAQSSGVVDVFFPGADGQTFIGSVITSDASQTTLAVTCPTETSDSDLGCGFDEPITVTVGPSTFHAEESFEGITAILECSLDGTTSALCAETYIGPAYLIDADVDDLTATDATTDTSLITTSTSTSLTGTDIVFIPVTLVSDLEGPAETGAGATTSTASQTGTTASNSGSGTTATTGTTGTTSATGSSTASATGADAAATTSSGNGAGRADGSMLTLSGFGAGLLGLAALLL